MHIDSLALQLFILTQEVFWLSGMQENWKITQDIICYWNQDYVSCCELSSKRVPVTDSSRTWAVVQNSWECPLHESQVLYTELRRFESQSLAHGEFESYTFEVERKQTSRASHFLFCPSLWKVCH